MNKKNPTIQQHQIKLATQCLHSTRLSKKSMPDIFSLKMATVMLSETLGDCLHLTFPIPENRSYTGQNKVYERYNL
jgi:hypothetical protein